MNILMLCFAIGPTRGSEYAVGWGWLLSAADGNRIHVITNDRCKDEILNEKSRNPKLSNINFYFVPWNIAGASSWYWPFIRPFRYHIWRKRAMKVAFRLKTSLPLDIAHHVNGTGILDVAPLWLLKLPFIWGPVGGTSLVDPTLIKLIPIKSRIFYIVKNLSRRLALRYAAGPKLAALHAHTIISATYQVQSFFRHRWKRESQLISEVGIDIKPLITPKSRTENEKFRIIWCGRLDSGKGLNILLWSLHKLRRFVNWELIVIGTGPMDSCFKDIANQLNILNRCRFLGEIQYEYVSQYMRDGHVFVMTSIYDLTSNVFVEAIVNGMPVVCLSTQSAADYIRPNEGIVINVSSPEQIYSDIASAIELLFSDEEFRISCAESSLAKANIFSWDNKKRLLSSIYSEASSI